MTVHAGRRQGLELSGTMAARAGGGSVFSRQRESRGSMIEPRACPLVDVVAGKAIRGEARSLMIHRSCLLKLRKVATGTRRVQSDVSSGRCGGVTGIAGQCSMRP
jgi:hypothetical protein